MKKGNKIISLLLSLTLVYGSGISNLNVFAQSQAKVRKNNLVNTKASNSKVYGKDVSNSNVLARSQIKVKKNSLASIKTSNSKTTNAKSKNLGKEVVCNGIMYRLIEGKNGNHAHIIKCETTETNITIPKNINVEGKKFSITRVETKAFEKYKSLKFIDLSKTNIEIIDRNAFADCESLESIKFPGTLKELGNKALKNTNVKSVDLSNTKVVNMGKESLADCKLLESIKFPGTLRDLGEEALKNTKVAEVNLANTKIVNIGNGVCKGCKSLKHFAVPETVKNVGENITKGTSVKKITLTEVKDNSQNISSSSSSGGSSSSYSSSSSGGSGSSYSSSSGGSGGSYSSSSSTDTTRVREAEVAREAERMRVAAEEAERIRLEREAEDEREKEKEKEAERVRELKTAIERNLISCRLCAQRFNNINEVADEGCLKKHIMKFHKTCLFNELVKKELARRERARDKRDERNESCPYCKAPIRWDKPEETRAKIDELIEQKETRKRELEEALRKNPNCKVCNSRIWNVDEVADEGCLKDHPDKVHKECLRQFRQNQNICPCCKEPLGEMDVHVEHRAAENARRNAQRVKNRLLKKVVNLDENNSYKGMKFKLIDDENVNNDEVNNDMKGQATVTEYNGADENVFIPKKVMSRGEKYLVTVIGKGAFAGKGIKTIDLSKTELTVIEKEACLNTDLEEIIIPESVVFVGNKAFDIETLKKINCKARFDLKDALGDMYREDNWEINNLDDKATWTKIREGEIARLDENNSYNGMKFELNEGNNTASLSEYDGQSKDVVVPGKVYKNRKSYKVDKIIAQAFAFTGIENVDLSPAKYLVSIGEYAFAGTLLRELTIPDSVKVIGDNALEIETLIRVYYKSRLDVRGAFGDGLNNNAWNREEVEGRVSLVKLEKNDEIHVVDEVQANEIHNENINAPIPLVPAERNAVIDGMKYRLIDNGNDGVDGTAVLIKHESNANEIVIPRQVVSEGKRYIVNDIAKGALNSDNLKKIECEAGINLNDDKLKNIFDNDEVEEAWNQKNDNGKIILTKNPYCPICYEYHRDINNVKLFRCGHYLCNNHFNEYHNRKEEDADNEAQRKINWGDNNGKNFNEILEEIRAQKLICPTCRARIEVVD